VRAIGTPPWVLPNLQVSTKPGQLQTTVVPTVAPTIPKSTSTIAPTTPKPTSTVASATAKPTATTASAPAQIQTLKGTGQQAPPPFTLTAGLTTFRMKHTGKSNFAVELLDANANTVELLANVIGSYDGGTAVSIKTAGKYSVNVDADGPWTIEILQPGAAERAAAVPLPQTFSGQGPVSSPLFSANSGSLRLAMKHSGDANFSVIVMDTQGRTIDLAANVIGPYDGSKVVRLPSKGIYILVVEANGPWTIEASQ